MKRSMFALALVALVLPASALGKGPSAATIDGPGGGITFRGCCEPGSGAMNLAEQAGFFPAAFPQETNRMLSSRPKRELGPRYTVTYTVPGPNDETFTIRQEIYPYAASGPVTYMAPGQPIFDMKTPGGWFQAGAELKETLVAAGLPASPPSASRGGSFPSVELFGLVAAALLVAAATGVVLRRRTQPAPAA
jgi:hypothetical protein